GENERLEDGLDIESFSFANTTGLMFVAPEFGFVVSESCKYAF
ncbi:unnamed protein product, partial [Brassica rapa subsp. trilocularis]